MNPVSEALPPFEEAPLPVLPIFYVGFRKLGLAPNSDVSTAMDWGEGGRYGSTLGGKKTAPRPEIQFSSTVFA